jgi:hypothetical protein
MPRASAARSPRISTIAAAVLELVRRGGPQTCVGIQQALALRSDSRRAAVAELRKAGLVEVRRGAVLGMAARTANYVFEPGAPPTPDRRRTNAATGLGTWGRL